jgi:hypothetical protein
MPRPWGGGATTTRYGESSKLAPLDAGTEPNTSEAFKASPATMRTAEHERLADMQQGTRRRLEVSLS